MCIGGQLVLTFQFGLLIPIYICQHMIEGVDKYNAWDIFKVEEAQDCESVTKTLEEVENAGQYVFDGDSQKQLDEIIQVLEERKRKLGCS